MLFVSLSNVNNFKTYTMTNSHTYIRNSEEAFNNAIQIGIFSTDKNNEFWAGNYMYMFSEATLDFFKNINTRKYESIKMN